MSFIRDFSRAMNYQSLGKSPEEYLRDTAEIRRHQAAHQHDLPQMDKPRLNDHQKELYLQFEQNWIAILLIVSQISEPVEDVLISQLDATVEYNDKEREDFKQAVKEALSAARDKLELMYNIATGALKSVPHLKKVYEACVDIINAQSTLLNATFELPKIPAA